MTFKIINKKLILFSFVILFSITGWSTQKKKAFMWFDLGNVIVDTRKGLKQIKYMPGALKYLQDLRQKGYLIGIITNIPEKLGQPGNYESKLKTVEQLIRKGWIDSKTTFSFSDYDEVLLPLYDQERKPAPLLFEKAQELSTNLKTKSFFQGETFQEVVAAREVGMFSHEININGETINYLPMKKINHVLSQAVSAEPNPLKK